MNLTNT